MTSSIERIRKISSSILLIPDLRPNEHIPIFTCFSILNILYSFLGDRLGGATVCVVYEREIIIQCYPVLINCAVGI